MTMTFGQASSRVRLEFETLVELTPTSKSVFAVEYTWLTNGKARSITDAWGGFEMALRIPADQLNALTIWQRVTLPADWNDYWSHVIWRVKQIIPNADDVKGNLVIEGMEKHYDKKHAARLDGRPYHRLDVHCTGTPPSPFGEV